jgi:hypothetical protein
MAVAAVTGSRQSIGALAAHSKTFVPVSLPASG